MSFEPFGLNIQQVPVEDEPSPGLNPHLGPNGFHVRNGTETNSNVNYQFIPSDAGRYLGHQSYQGNLEYKNLSALRNGPNEESLVSLHLGGPQSKRRKHSNSSFGIEEVE